jgi:Carboxypeptidase regulatory-like domain
LADGRYYIMAGAENYQPQFFQQAYSVESAQVIGVAAGAVLAGIDFLLDPTSAGTGVVAGTVTATSNGASLPDAEVFAYNPNLPFRSYHAAVNNDGTYRIEGMTAGNYLVEAWAPGYFRRFYKDAETPENATQVNVRDGEVAGDIDFALPRSGSISGRVVNPDGEPIAGASIFVTMEGIPNSDSTATIRSPD